MDLGTERGPPPDVVVFKPTMISLPGSASTTSGNVGPHMLSRAVVVTTIGSLNAFAALVRATTLCFKFARRIVTDAVIRPNLMIDEDERHFWEVRGFVRADLISHGILLRL